MNAPKELFDVIYVNIFNSRGRRYGLTYRVGLPHVSLDNVTGRFMSDPVFTPVYYIQHVFDWWNTKAHRTYVTAKCPSDFAIMIQLVKNK